MAAELNESELDDNDLAKVVLLQAHVRGFLVRKWLGQLKTDFSTIVEELEPEAGIYLHWRSSMVCLPVLSKTKPQPLPTGGSQERTAKPFIGSRHPCALRTSAAVQTEVPSAPKNGHPHRSTVTQRNSHALSDSLHQKESSGSRVVQRQAQSQNLRPKMARLCDRDVETEEELGVSLGTFAFNNRDEILRMSDKFASTSQDMTQAKRIEESLGAKEVHMQIVSSSPEGETPVDGGKLLPADVDALRELRKNTALELLWIQQAINSRKNYLKIKAQMQGE